MPCNNCGQPMLDEDVDARLLRHSGGGCDCAVCEVCGERITGDDAEAIYAHQTCHEYPTKHGKAVADICEEDPYMSLANIARRIGVSPERVRQIVARQNRLARRAGMLRSSLDSLDIKMDFYLGLHIVAKPINHIGGGERRRASDIANGVN